jgi:hypothetical protein
MRIFSLIAAAAVVLATAGTVQAAPKWTQAAYYLIVDTEVGPFVVSGPYADQQACEAVKPASDADMQYFCDYLETRPEWDD